MSYRRTLLRRWSRRDWLAVLVVALAVAFLTGAGLVVDAAATGTTEIAADQSSPATATWHDSPADARAAAAGDGRALVLPVARVQVDGESRLVVAVPPDAAAFENRTGIRLPAPPPEGTVRRGDERGTVDLGGQRATETVDVRPAAPSALSPRWYLARPAAVDRLGPTGALVLAADGEGGSPVVGAAPQGAGGAPVQGALPFFLAGARDALRLVGVIAAGAGVLLGVAVFGVARIAVRARRRTIRAVRATGATPRAVTLLFAARTGAQTAVGVALGYAVGVIATRAAVSAAVYVGHPVALAPQVSRRLVTVLGPAYLAFVGLGALSGAAAAWGTARVAPAELSGDEAAPSTPRKDRPDGGPSAVLRRVSPDLLGWRAALPAATTLAVFVTFAVVAASTYGVVAPLSGGQGGTITEPGAPHPVASEVPTAHAAALRDRGVAASPEILLLSVRDGQPFVARGANFSAFAGLSAARLSRGRPPDGPDEAVVGTDLAATLGVAVGEEITLGGSTTPAVERVRVVGVYAAREPFDDQLVVPLATARHLAGRPPGTANLIRVERVPAASGEVSVVGVDAPDRVAAGGSFEAAATVVNPTARERTTTVALRFDGERRRERVTLAPGARRTVTVAFPAGDAGRRTLSAGERSRSVRVVPRDAIRIEGLPDRAPPGSEPLVTVTTATGDPVANATVTVGGETRRTDGAGRVRVPLADAGEVRVRTAAGDRTATRTVTVADGATRRLSATVTVDPARPTVATAPTARVALSNPWNRTLARTVTVAGPNATTTREVRLGPGERRTVAAPLGRRGPGTYEVTVRDGRGGELARTTYRVVGDERLSAALASTGRGAPSTGIGRAAVVLFGNLELLVAVLLLLAGLMTAGATTAAFAGAVHARRRTLGVHRAVGASPWAVLRLVLADAAVVGAAATLLALVLSGAALWALDAAGLLTVYGVRLLAAVSPAVVAGAALAALALALVGAAAATWGLVRDSPAALLAATGQRHATADRTDGVRSPVETNGVRSPGETNGVRSPGEGDDA